MSKIVWDATSERKFETGVSKGVHYSINEKGEYTPGVPWNGLTGVTETPSGAELTDLWADGIKYASLRAAEIFGGTIEAYTYPDEFAECDGSAEPEPGVYLGQQKRKPFGFSYRSEIGNDVDGLENEKNYKLHLIYNATVNPSEKAYTTVNDSPDAMTMSWEVNTTPVSVTGYKPTSCLTIDSTKVDSTKLAALEKILYGDENTDPRMPLPDEVISILKNGAAAAAQTTDAGTGEG